MAIFIVLWYYLLSTKISCLLHNNFGHTNILCGPSMIDCPETSGNLQKPAAVVFGRFLLTIFFLKKQIIQSNLVIRNFLVTLELFLNAKCSLHYEVNWQLVKGKWFLNNKMFLIKTFLITKFDCTNKNFGNLPETFAVGLQVFPAGFRIIHH